MSSPQRDVVFAGWFLLAERIAYTSHHHLSSPDLPAVWILVLRTVEVGDAAADRFNGNLQLDHQVGSFNLSPDHNIAPLGYIGAPEFNNEATASAMT